MTLAEAKSSAEFNKFTILVDTDYTVDNHFDVDKDIILQLKDKGVSRDILIALYFCLSEATDNTIEHGNVNHGHITVGVDNNAICLLIFDEGDGICNTLRGKYPDESNENILKKALLKSTSSDHGCGNGLYAWNLMAKSLAFYFEIISNDIALVHGLKDFSYLCTHKGTILNIELPLTTDLTWDKILDDDAFKTLEDDYKDLIEEDEDEDD